MQKVQLFILFFYFFPDELDSIVLEGVVEFEGIVPAAQANRPIFVISDIVIFIKLVLVEGEVGRVCAEGLV